MTDKNKKNLLEKLREVFSSNVEETTELNFVDVKTEDGRILRVEDMAPEKAIIEITEEGEVALEDGEYKIVDGPVIKVENGLIKEIEAMEEEPEMEDDIVSEEMSEEVAEEVIEDVVDEVIEEDVETEALLTQLRELVASVNELKGLKEEFTSIKEENETLKKQVEKFAKEPSATETIVKETFKKEVKNNDSIMYNILTSKK